MHVATTILLLLFITALSNLLARLLRLLRLPVPLPLLQIGLGTAASLLGVHVAFEPDVFMLLFIPPLLFADAYLMPMREFLELKRIILMLALGLVLFTTIGCGYFIHWLIPAMPIAACFALAAVLSPTDAVAVSGMIEGRAVPHRFMHILSGEALLNDASGLVCFKFAAAAAVTGTFSLWHATGAFVLMSLAGVAVGAVLAMALVLTERWLIGRASENSTIVVTISALLPFAAYLAAEHLDASGILAAVAAGITLKQRRMFGATRTETRLQAEAVWSLLTFAFNGLIFLLLGLQLPSLLRGGIALARTAEISPWLLLLGIVEITSVLVLLRLAWISFSLLLRWATAGPGRTGTGASPTPPPRPSVWLVGATSVAGVRGAITLAAVLSLGSDFPERDLLVTLAAGVIVASLGLAALTLPALLRGIAIPDSDPMQSEAGRARLALAQLATQAVEHEMLAPDAEERTRGWSTEREEVLSRLLDEFRARAQRLHVALDPNAADDDERLPALRRHRMETAIRLHVLRIGRDRLARMIRSNEINDQTERLLVRELDHEEEVLLATARSLPRDIGMTDDR